ncbi:hypothetical protein C0J52_16425 [Blattella germanica]|nr:hypothetical protein C0J52_16425 [Blattella germanica]
MKNVKVLIELKNFLIFMERSQLQKNAALQMQSNMGTDITGILSYQKRWPAFTITYVRRSIYQVYV